MAKNRILIVEDQQSLILFYKGILASLDIKIDTAASFDEAMVKLKDYDYCFHILDISLRGDIPGTDIIGKCGADSKSCLILSSTLTEEVVSNLVDVYGIPRDLIMTKPVDSDRLVELIKARIEPKEQIPESNNSLHDDSNKKQIHLEVKITGLMFQYVKKHPIRSLVVTLFLIMFTNFFITYLKVDAYNDISRKMDQRNEKMFKHYNHGTDVTGTTYVDFSGYQLIKHYSNVKNDGANINPLLSEIKHNASQIKRLRVKFYPDNNYLIIITDTNNKIRQVWIPDDKYVASLGIGEDLTMLDIFIRAWKLSFKHI